MTTAFRVPEAKVVPLEDDLRPTPKAPMVEVVKSWTVELVNTGVSSTQLVLSNQRTTAKGLPIAPAWRFNNLQEFKPGKLFRVDFRYVDSPEGRSSAGGWRPMIVARVVSMDFSFPQSGPSTVTLEGEDLLSRLKVFPERDVAWGRSRDPDKEGAILARVLRDADSGLTSATVPNHVFFRGYRRLHQRKNQTYLKFLRDRADELDWELFVDFRDPTSPESAVDVHFEPHRSGTPTTLEPALVWGANLLDFQPRFEFWRQLTSVRVRGRNPWGGAVDETADISTVRRFLHPVGAPHLLNAVEVRNRFEDGSDVNTKELTGQRMDDDRAQAKATATLMETARKFLTAQVKTVGNPTLRPGRHVELGGLHAPFDGLYYIQKARHSFDDGGYLTHLTLCRPGYLDPAQYAAGGA